MISLAVAAPGRNGNPVASAAGEKLRRHAGADREVRAQPRDVAEFLRPCDRANAQDEIGQGLANSHQRVACRLTSQGDLDGAQTAGPQGFGQRHRLLQPLDRDHGNDRGGR
jgi:hypothetical protein